MTTTPRPTASPEAEPLWTRAASIASALEVAKHLAVLQAADTPAAAVATTRHLHGIIAGALASLHDLTAALEALEEAQEEQA